MPSFVPLRTSRRPRVFGDTDFLRSAILALAALPMGVLAGEPDPITASWPSLLLNVGHGDYEMAPTIERYGLVVTEVGEPNEEGIIDSFSFSVAMSSFGTTVVAINGLRGWRISFVSGEHLGTIFQVRSNTAEELDVTSAFGPLDGIVVGDLLFVERIPVRQPIQPQPTNFLPVPEAVRIIAQTFREEVI